MIKAIQTAPLQPPLSALFPMKQFITITKLPFMEMQTQSFSESDSQDKIHSFLYSSNIWAH